MSNQEQDKKAAHRPKGSPDKKSAFVRDEIFNKFRCTRGFNEVVNEIKTVGNYKSKADVMHEALQILAARKATGNIFLDQ